MPEAIEGAVTATAKPVLHVMSRADSAFREMMPWRDQWQQIIDYMLPNAKPTNRDLSPGQKTTQKLFDSTAINSNAVMAASMHSLLTNQINRWFGVATPYKDVNDDVKSRTWLEEVADIVHTTFRLSNINSELNETYIDVGAFGTGCLLEEERGEQGSGDIRFQAIPIGDYAIEEDLSGDANALHRKYKSSAYALAAEWGTDVSEETRKRVASGHGHEKVEILHSVYPIDEKGKEFKWRSMYIEKKKKHVISNQGYKKFPFMVPRWSKRSGEIYGRGPGYIALPDIKTLNKSKELGLKHFAKTINPTVLLPEDSLFGKMYLTPGGINFMKGDTEKARFFTPPTSPGYESFKTTELKDSIKEMFFHSQLQLAQGPQMTATEVERRYEIMNRVLGPTLGRLEYELLKPMVERALQILSDAKKLPPMPEKMQKKLQAHGVIFSTDGTTKFDLTVVYEGPLARAQKTTKIGAIVRFFELTIPAAQIKPEVLDNINFDTMLREMADASALPPKALRTLDEVAAIREDRAKQQAAAQQQEAEAQGAENLQRGGAGIASIAAAGGNGNTR